MLICVVGSLVLLHAQGYLAGHPHLGRFYSFLWLFLASMLGLVLAANLVCLYVFWELTSFASFLLIGFDHRKQASRKAAWQALLITSLGGLAFLAGLIMLGIAGGSFELPELLRKTVEIKNHAYYKPALMLILLGAFTKSAQWPFHIWLPAAMEAPAPVSAYLHSATMVKAGIYLLARLSPVLGGTSWWSSCITAIGCITIVTGASLALSKTDAKQALAYSTVAVLGLLTMLIGIGSSSAVGAMIVYLSAHAFYKGALFLVIGNVDHETGERSFDRLGNLARAMPLTCAAAGLAALSMAGLPPALGFIGKELVFEAAGPGGLPLLALVMFFGASAVAVAIYCSVLIFWAAPAKAAPTAPHEHVKALTYPPLILGACGLISVAFSPDLVRLIFGPAAGAVLGSKPDLNLELWHGLNRNLLLGVAATVGGAAAAMKCRRIFWDFELPFKPLRRLKPSYLYDDCMSALNQFARWQTNLLQNGSLHNYIIVTLVTMIALVGGTLCLRAGAPMSPPPFQALPLEWVMAALITSSWIAIIFLSQLLAVIAALGAVGYGVALTFMLFGGVDVAITQFAIETLSVILFVLVLYRLPQVSFYSSRKDRAIDFTVAALGGLLFTILLAGVSQETPQSDASQFFLSSALSLAHGRNVVNVIIVDFRALDTLGEISVLAIAALGIFGLLKLKIVADLPLPFPALKPGVERYPSVILLAASRFLLPLLLLFSFYLLIRGHNAPGGGFVGGLTAAAAFTLHMMAHGVNRTRRALRLPPKGLIALGLLVSLGSASVPVRDGLPFFTGIWAAAEYPLIGRIGTPIVFDCGVFLIVLGVLLLVFFSLAEES